MHEGIVFVGAGAHARKLSLYAKLIGLTVCAFVDDDSRIASPLPGAPCLTPGEVSDLQRGQQFLVAIGNSAARKVHHERYVEMGWIPLTMIHPSAYVAADAQIGAGTVVCANAVVESGAVIGIGTIIDIGVLIDHDSFVGDYQHVTPGSVLPPYSRVPN